MAAPSAARSAARWAAPSAAPWAGRRQADRARKLAPQIGALQKESGDDPDFPALLRRSGRFYVVLAKICVSRTGSVDSVTILQGADTLLDGNVVSAVKKWRYRPLMADSNAVPFCYFGRFEFKAN